MAATTDSPRPTIEVEGHQVLLADSVSSLSELDRGGAVVAASHGGISAAEHVLKFMPSLIALNDAGAGKDGAGYRALGILAEHDVAAVTVGHETARIGEAVDHWENGLLTRVNGPAASRGARVGMSVQEAFGRVLAG